MDIKTALSQLDPMNDDHWTSDGSPRMDAVAKILGDESVKRKDVTDAAPDFTRDTALKAAIDREAAEKAEADAKGEDPSQEQVSPAAAPAEQTEPETIMAEPEPIVQEAEQPAAETVAEPEPDQRSPHQVEYDRVSADIVELQNAHKKIDEMLKPLYERQRALSRYVDHGGYNHKADQDARMAFIKSQQEQRARRMGHQVEVMKALGMPNPARSPLDAAMQRKPARGQTRPVMSLVKPAGDQ